MYCCVLHIGIYLHCTNSNVTPKSYACFQHANTRSDRMFGCVFMLKASTGLVCLFAFCTIYRYICQCVTQNSTFTRQNTLFCIILVHITMYTTVLRGHVCNKVIQIDSSQEARLAQSREYQTSNLRVVGSSPTDGRNFSFCILSLSTRSWQVDLCHANEIKHDVHPRYIGAQRKWQFERKMVVVLHVVPNTL